jgi:arginine-glutamic acid dipeptide repeat-containing protein
MEVALAERMQAERMSLDPMLRLQMAGGISAAQAAAQAAAQQAHTHTHAHSHTHLHLHQPDGLLPPSFHHPVVSMAPGFLPPGLYQGELF